MTNLAGVSETSQHRTRRRMRLAAAILSTFALGEAKAKAVASWLNVCLSACRPMSMINIDALLRSRSLPNDEWKAASSAQLRV